MPFSYNLKGMFKTLHVHAVHDQAACVLLWSVVVFKDTSEDAAAIANGLIMAFAVRLAIMIMMIRPILRMILILRLLVYGLSKGLVRRQIQL
jgi:tryptophan-rich sensory protein